MGTFWVTLGFIVVFVVVILFGAIFLDFKDIVNRELGKIKGHLSLRYCPFDGTTSRITDLENKFNNLSELKKKKILEKLERLECEIDDLGKE